MRPQTNRLALALALVALLQTGVLAAMVLDRMRLVATGREIVLPIVPVDPRDLFRGDYVELGYDVGRVPARLLEGPPPSRHDPCFVTLEKGQDGAWLPVKLTRDRPQEASANRIVLKGRSRFGWWASEADTTNAVNLVRYGIEHYFVPQGEGSRLEALARDKKLAALIAVDGRGNAAIKGLLIDGRLAYEEPLL
jgi:uncharacterized membrane-anchored protein